MYLDVAVSHKFYFNGHIPYSIFSSLFGDYSMFEDNEKVCNNTSINDTRTYHIMARDKIYSLLKIDDIYLSAYRSYNMEEVDHQLCSYGTMDGIGPNNQQKGIIFMDGLFLVVVVSLCTAMTITICAK